MNTIAVRGHFSTPIVVLCTVILFNCHTTGLADSDGKVRPKSDERKPAADRATKSLTPKPNKDLNPLPMGAVQRFGTEQFRVSGAFKTIEFSADDRLLMINTQGSLTLLSRDSGLPVKDPRFDFGTSLVMKVRTSPDGKLIAAVVLDDLSTGVLQPNYRIVVLVTESPRQRVFPLPQDRLTSNNMNLIFSPDKKTLVLSTPDGGVRFWNVESGEELKRANWAKLGVRAVAFSPDGQTLVVVGHKTLFWKWQTDAAPSELFREYQGMNLAAKYSPDGKWLVTGHSGPQGSAVLDAATGQVAWHFYAQREPVNNPELLAISPESRLLAAGYIHTHVVELWDMETQQRIHSFECREPRSVAFSRDGTWLVAAANGSLIHFWDLTNFEPAVAIPDGHVESVNEMRFTPDGQTLLTASRDSTLRVWDVATGKQKYRFDHEPGQGVHGLTVSHDGSLAVSLSNDDTLGVWDLSKGKRIQNLEAHGPRSNSLPVHFSPDGSRFVTWGDDMRIRWWNTANGKLLETHETKIAAFVPLDPNNRNNQERDLSGLRNRRMGQFSSDAKTLLVEMFGQVYEFDTANGQERRNFPIGGMYNRCLLSPDGRSLVSSQYFEGDAASKPRLPVPKVIYRDFATLQTLWQTRLPGLGISPLAFSPDSKSVAYYTFGNSCSIEVANVQTGEVTIRIPDVSRCDAFQFSPDGKQLASALTNSSILLWDLAKFSVANDVKGIKPKAANSVK
ncbi:MAG: repeat protein [Planctomycetaceae bacterium]|nr:repeat protein [Planctomycetaceae bacterium]